MLGDGEPSFMNHKLNLILALAAGLLGGLISRYLVPTPVHAQTQTAAPKELRAQSFVLVNERGTSLGLFGFDPKGVPIIKFVDEHGSTIWSTQSAFQSK
jgi:hypothetical protein